MDRLTKINKILLFAVLTVTVLYFGGPFLKPFFFGVLLASLMMPFSDFLESKGINRVFASIISTIVLIIAIGAILTLLIFQLNQFVQEISAFGDELKSFIADVRDRIASFTNLSLERQSQLWQERSQEFLNNVENIITGFISDFLNFLVELLIVMLYVILLLLYRKKIYEFIMMYVRQEKKRDSEAVLSQINKVVGHYLWGRVQVMAVLAVMYYIAFLTFDLPYAVLILIFATLITIIPYLGPFVSGLIPIVFAIIFFESLSSVLIFTVIIIIIQLTESYVLEPLIIGKEVKLNPLIVIVAVITGGLIWGIAGMVLFVPLFAMVNIISKYSVGMEPISYLFATSMGDKKKKK